MRNIVLGKNQEGKNVEIDLKTLLRTRFLVQAASGGGKSRTLRRLAEQFFGKVPVWIIDKEDEFPSLRDKFGYVFAGPGGETPIDPRSAELVCERLLKAKASAIFGLYSLKDPIRHEWVRIFLNALMNAPKSLWTHMIVMVDESHKFCPEKGAGESVAREAMTDLAVDGRKRGFCAGYFTQRLGKLSKNASAELINRLIGKTVEDIDVDRAVELMSVRRAEREEFEYGIKRLKAGHFWSFGDAISVDRVLVHVGDIQTIHPEPGAPAMAVLPPLPEKMKTLLPQLADLPKEAETKARTEADLRKEILDLKRAVATKDAALAKTTPAAPPPRTVEKVVEKVVEVPAVDAKTISAMGKMLTAIEKAVEKFDPVSKFEAALRGLGARLSTQLSEACTAADRFRKAPALRAAPAAPRPLPAPAPKPRAVAQVGGAEASNGELSRPQLGILRGMAEFMAIGVNKVARPQLAGWLSKKVTGSYLNDLGRLRTEGYLVYEDMDLVLTELGNQKAPAAEADPTPEGIFIHLLEAVSGPQREILKACREQGDWISREDLAAALGKKVTGSFLNDLGALRSAKMIEYGDGQWKMHVRLQAWTQLAQEAAV